ncbi:MAG: cysteine desulfurase NifS [Lachnospiraceae bacterium]|nr:cysteine desulfurase NifS [Lachnospiraceae bacterium]
MNNLIYLDNAATTKLHTAVLDEMLPYFSENFSNPAGIYASARKSKAAIEKARAQVAAVIGATPNEIYFTSGGSESDNWAIKGVADALKTKGNHIITTKIEHHAILHTCEYLEKCGYEVTYLNVDENGVVKLDELKAAIRPTTVLISVMFANNEIGTIQPIAEIGRIAKEHGVLFHTDAVQAFGHVPMNVEDMNIDLLSASAHKFHGPKGVGFLYIRKGVKIQTYLHGGAQERGRRGSTHNVPGIIGMGKAAELAVENLVENSHKMSKLRDYLMAQIQTKIPFAKLNGHPVKRLPNNVNFCFRFIEGESLLIMLDSVGICASSGSACTSGSLDPSHVLLAIGLPHEIAHGSLRLTLSEETTKEELDYVIEKLSAIVERLRSMSPLYEDFVKEN